MFKLAALLVASAAAAAATAAAATSTDTLSSSPWWEKVTVTLDGNGTPEACRYETSLSPAATQDCDVDSSQAATAKHVSSSKGDITQITFERRFDPGAAPPKPKMETGDTLLGGQMMALAIDPHGQVKDCRVVAASGSMRPDYSCDDASAERFQASLNSAGKPAAERDGYMTILVYGHSEHMV